MKIHTTIALLFISLCSLSQTRFDSAFVERKLVTPEEPLKQEVSPDIIRAIKAVDRHYRTIVDTLYPFKSKKYTILEPVYIETDVGAQVDPLSFADKIVLSSLLFESAALNRRLRSITRKLSAGQRQSLFAYLGRSFDNFSPEDTTLKAQPVRIRYIKFPDAQFIHIGLDIYGAHFRWVADRKRKWDVVAVSELWVY